MVHAWEEGKEGKGDRGTVALELKHQPVKHFP